MLIKKLCVCVCLREREGDGRIKGEGGRRRYCGTQKKEIEIHYKIYKTRRNWNNFLSLKKK